MSQFSDLSAILTILSAMITPAVLISACGSLTISTANRLGRVIDRTRKLADELEDFVQSHSESVLAAERHKLLFEQLRYSTKRAQLLHRALTCLYIALGTFVSTSVAIGLVEVFHERFAWLPLLLGMIGACFLFYTCVLLIAETQTARMSIAEEMSFALRLRQQYIPKDYVEPAPARWRLINRTRGSTSE